MPVINKGGYRPSKGPENPIPPGQRATKSGIKTVLVDTCSNCPCLQLREGEHHELYQCALVMMDFFLSQEAVNDRPPDFCPLILNTGVVLELRQPERSDV